MKKFPLKFRELVCKASILSTIGIWAIFIEISSIEFDIPDLFYEKSWDNSKMAIILPNSIFKKSTPRLSRFQTVR